MARPGPKVIQPHVPRTDPLQPPNPGARALAATARRGTQKRDRELTFLRELLPLVQWIYVRLADRSEHPSAFYLPDPSLKKLLEQTQRTKPTTPRDVVRAELTKFFRSIRFTEVVWSDVAMPAHRQNVWVDPEGIFTRLLPLALPEAIKHAISELHEIRTTIAAPPPILALAWFFYYEAGAKEERYGTKPQWRAHVWHAALQLFRSDTMETAKAFLCNLAGKRSVSAAVVLRRRQVDAEDCEKLAGLLIHLGNAALWMDRDFETSDALFQLAYKITGWPHIAGNVCMRMWYALTIPRKGPQLLHSAVRGLYAALMAHLRAEPSSRGYRPPHRDQLAALAAVLPEGHAWKLAEAANLLSMGLRMLARSVPSHLEAAIEWLDRSLLFTRDLPEHVVMEAHIRSNYARALIVAGREDLAWIHAAEATRLIGTVPPRGTHFLQETIFHIRFTDILVTPLEQFDGSDGQRLLDTMCRNALAPVKEIYGESAPVVEQFHQQLIGLSAALLARQPYAPPGF